MCRTPCIAGTSAKTHTCDVVLLLSPDAGQDSCQYLDQRCRGCNNTSTEKLLLVRDRWLRRHGGCGKRQTPWVMGCEVPGLTRAPPMALKRAPREWSCRDSSALGSPAASKLVTFINTRIFLPYARSSNSKTAHQYSCDAMATLTHLYGPGLHI